MSSNINNKNGTNTEMVTLENMSNASLEAHLRQQAASLVADWDAQRDTLFSLTDALLEWEKRKGEPHWIDDLVPALVTRVEYLENDNNDAEAIPRGHQGGCRTGPAHEPDEARYVPDVCESERHTIHG